jgi:hypothetical protein
VVNVDRIFIDILDWVRRLVHSRDKAKPIPKPYQRLESWRGHLGVLHRVERDTPRAIATYIFSPFRFNGYRVPTPKDLHICLDHLSLLPGQVPSHKIPYTHRITVLLASHWHDATGCYETSLLYTADWDFQGSSRYRDRWAIAITHDVARQLKSRPWDSINWAFEFECSAKQIMGRDYQDILGNKKAP